jgi:DNA-binding LacI/PurR family transcriptional regulator
MLKNEKFTSRRAGVVTLRTVADKVGLAPCSVSAVLNNSAAALAIPQRTKNRILSAARQLNYRPNFSARSLRTKRTYTVAIIASDFGNPQVGRIVAGVELFLREKGYSLLIASCDNTPEWFENHSTQLLQRGVEGIITIDTARLRSFGLPVVFVDLPNSRLPEPITTPKRQRLAAMGETAANSIVAHIEEKSGSLTRIALAPEPRVGFLHPETVVTVHKLDVGVEHFAD